MTPKNIKENEIDSQGAFIIFNDGYNLGFEKGKASKQKDVLKIIDEMIEIKKEERVLWEHNLLRNGKSIHQKGYFKNPDFQIQANAMIYELEELKKKIEQK